MPYRLGGVAGEVVVHEGRHGQPLPQHLDGPRALGDLVATVDDDVVQRRGQGIDGLAVAQQGDSN